MSFAPTKELDLIMEQLGLSESGFGQASFLGKDPILKSRLRLGACAAVPIMAAAASAAAVWKQRTGQHQKLTLDLRQAVHQISPHITWSPTLSGSLYPHPLIADNHFLLDPYQTKDDRTVMACGVYPHMVASWLRFLDCPPDREKIARAFRQWDSGELEDECAKVGLALSIARSSEEWLAHPQGEYLSTVPVVQLKKITPSAPVPWKSSERPLGGVRVLSFSHAIAGPTVGRTLAEQGADVLSATFPNHYEHDFIYDEANIGSRSPNLDLTIPEQRSKVDELLRDTDIMVNNHRHGKLEALGLEPEKLAAEHPGLIFVKISCYGSKGSWALRGGFDMNASAASGLMCSEGGKDAPRLPLTGMINDFTTGYLAAAGATAALYRRALEGGSWQVEVSLARTAMWFQSFGLVEPSIAGSDEEHKPREPEALDTMTPLGPLHRLAPPVLFSRTPGYWSDPVLVPRGSSAAAWL